MNKFNYLSEKHRTSVSEIIRNGGYCKDVYDCKLCPLTVEGCAEENIGDVSERARDYIKQLDEKMFKDLKSYDIKIDRETSIITVIFKNVDGNPLTVKFSPGDALYLSHMIHKLLNQ